MNILIAGSSGIIGSYLCNELNKHNNFSVIGIGAEELNTNKYLQIDLTNVKNTFKGLENIAKPDVLIFLVALAHDKGKNKELTTFRIINFSTLVNVLEVLKQQNKLPKKIIFSSTISVYGEKYDTSLYKEDTEKTPKTPYAVTKLEAEDFLIKNYESISWILRFAPVYSSRFKLNIDRRTRIQNKFYCIGDGKNKLSLLSIKNILKVVEAIIEDKVPAGIYNVSDENEYTFEDLLKIQKSKVILRVPRIVIKLIYYLNRITKINFIEENAIKLLTDNIYPSFKIQKFVKLNNNLNSTL